MGWNDVSCDRCPNGHKDLRWPNCIWDVFSIFFFLIKKIVVRPERGARDTKNREFYSFILSFVWWKYGARQYTSGQTKRQFLSMCDRCCGVVLLLLLLVFFFCLLCSSYCAVTSHTEQLYSIHLYQAKARAAHFPNAKCDVVRLRMVHMVNAPFNSGKRWH